MTAKRLPGGLPLAFTTEELASVRYNGRTGRPRRGEVKRIWGNKLMRLILQHFHEVTPTELDDALLTSKLVKLHLPPQRRVTKRPFNLLKVEYTLSRRSRTVHTRYFYFVVEKLGVSGVLYEFRYVTSQIH